VMNQHNLSHVPVLSSDDPERCPDRAEAYVT
jgi:hypothetical protein